MIFSPYEAAYRLPVKFIFFIYGREMPRNAEKPIARLAAPRLDSFGSTP